MNLTSSQRTDTAALNKRIVMCTSSKGGTGKSLVARFLLDMYLANNIPAVPYDCDPNNPQLWRHYNSSVPGGVKTIKFNQRIVSGVLQDDLEKLAPNVVLLDLPSGVGEYFQDFVQDIEAANLGYRITMVSVLGRSKDSIIQLKRLIELCGPQVDYVVVKNLYWDRDEKEDNAFLKYKESKTRQSASELGAIELNFFLLVDRVYEEIDSLDLTFTEAVANKALRLSTQGRLSVWIPKQESELLKGGSLLRLEGAKPRDRNTLIKGAIII